jgi:glycosyltransferase involved in cell wall biosynthesis
MSAPNLPLNSHPSAMTGHEARPMVFGTTPAPFLLVAPRRAHPLRIAVVGNHLPRQCGIATFTTDLCDAIAAEFGTAGVFVVAVNDSRSGYTYPARVRLEIAQNDLLSYRTAADSLNSSGVDVVCLQHEYGIYGGEAGSYVLQLLKNLKMPVVTTLHTVLREPNAAQRAVMQEICRRSERLIVMSEHSALLLRLVFGVPVEKIEVIPHGIPDLQIADPDSYKELFSICGKTVMLTFGLLSPNKGFESVIRALPRILSRHDDVVYIIAGATHPHVRLREGDRYRGQLEALARELGVERNVVFHNRFFAPQEMASLVGAADIYITPYCHEAQAVSGTLAFALGAGKAIISTPYWHAVELLDDGRGMLVPFEDARAIAAAAIELLENEAACQAMRRLAYSYGRDMVWNRVAHSYMRAFAHASADCTQPVRLGISVEAVKENCARRLEIA